MSDSIHVLIVRAAGLSLALPMGSVEQTLAFGDRQVHDVAGTPVVVFRDDALEVVRIGARLGFAEDGPLVAGVVVWAGARRRVFAVDELVGQMVLEPQDVPRCRPRRAHSGVVILPSAISSRARARRDRGRVDACGRRCLRLQRAPAQRAARDREHRLRERRHGALGAARKARRDHLCRGAARTLAEAADKIGAAAAPSAVVDTPVADDGGKVLLLFPDGAGEQLCELFGTRLDDEMGRSALREVGNILASSYLNAVVEMTGHGARARSRRRSRSTCWARSSRAAWPGSGPSDPTVLMRSVMTVEASDSSFAFLFVPFGAVTSLLDALGVGSPHPA